MPLAKSVVVGADFRVVILVGIVRLREKLDPAIVTTSEVRQSCSVADG